jgi:hypothetical protein
MCGDQIDEKELLLSKRLNACLTEDELQKFWIWQCWLRNYIEVDTFQW